MKKLKKIVVATDFSPTAADALREAAELAQNYEAQLVIVHVLQPPNYLVPEAYLTYSPQFFGETLRGLNSMLADARKKAEAAGASHVSSELLQGVTATEIVGYADSHDCDLIVIGTHGRTGVTHALLGSIAEKVVRGASCPVLTVRPTERAAA